MRNNTLLLLTAALVACKGPAPSRPSGAKIVYAAPPFNSNQQCSGQNQYIGPVAITPQGMGFAMLEPYITSNGNCGNGGGSPQGNLTLTSFTLDGNNVSGNGMMVLGQIQTNNSAQFLPRIAPSAAGANWLIESNNNGNLEFGPVGSTGSGVSVQVPNINQPAFPVAIQNFMGNLFIGGGNAPNNNGTPDINSPEFPCCGNGIQVQNESVSFGPFSTTTLTMSDAVMPFSAAVGLQKNIVVGDGMNFYFLQTDGGGFDIMQFSGSGSSSDMPTKLTMIQAGFPNPIPVGMAMDNSGNVVVALAANVYSGGQQSPGCSIWHYNVNSMTPNKAFETTKFSCNDLALDGQAYFIIVDTNASCSGCSGQLRGVGLGRVGFNGMGFNSVSFGLAAEEPGPRTLHIVPGMAGGSFAGTVFVVDPFEIAAIAETQLDNKQEIPQ